MRNFLALALNSLQIMGRAFFSPPQEANVLQWLDGTQTALGYYDGSTYVTVTKTQTITDEWQCFFESDEVITADPSTTSEKIYASANTGANLALDADTQVLRWGGNGGPSFSIGAMSKGKKEYIKVEMKLDSVKVTLNDTIVENSVTAWDILSWPYFVLGANRVFNDKFSGFIGAFSDGDKTYYPDQTYPEVTLTDPNGTYRKYDSLPDRTGNVDGLYDNVPQVVDASGADRAIGSDYDGAYIPLTTEPCLHKAQWRIAFTVNAPSGNLDDRLYAEGGTIESDTLFGIGTNSSGDGSELRVYLRIATGNYYSGRTTLPVFDGDTHDVIIERDNATINVTIDGVSQTILNTLPVGDLPVSLNTSTIGALILESLITSDFTGKLWNFQKCDQALIPINDGTGKDIKDINGNSVGTLTDPNGTFWDKGIVNKINIDPNGTLEALLLLPVGTLNKWDNRVGWDQTYTDLLVLWGAVWAFITPNTTDSKLSDPYLFRTIIYALGTSLEAFEELENQKHTGRPVNLVIDANGDSAVDSNGDIPIGA